MKGIPVEGHGSHGDGGALLHEQVKEIGSKISQWVGSSPLDKKGAQSSEAPRFGWGKKFGGGALLEKTKQSQTNTNTGRSPQKLNASESDAVEESKQNETCEDQSVDPEQGESL
jgi:hypothetical protein